MPFTLTPATPPARGARPRWRVAVEVRLGGDAVARPAEAAAGPGRAVEPRDPPARGGAVIARGAPASGPTPFCGGCVALRAAVSWVGMRPERGIFPAAEVNSTGFDGRRDACAVDGGNLRLGEAGFAARGLAGAAAVPAGFAMARMEARATFLPAGFRLLGFAAADALVAGFAAPDFFSGFFGFAGFADFAGFFAAAVFFATAVFLAERAPPAAAGVMRAVALAFFVGDTSLVFCLSPAAVFLVARFDFPAMVSLSLRYAGELERTLFGLDRYSL